MLRYHFWTITHRSQRRPWVQLPHLSSYRHQNLCFPFCLVGGRVAQRLDKCHQHASSRTLLLKAFPCKPCTGMPVYFLMVMLVAHFTQQLCTEPCSMEMHAQELGNLCTEPCTMEIIAWAHFTRQSMHWAICSMELHEHILLDILCTEPFAAWQCLRPTICALSLVLWKCKRTL